MKKAIAKGPDLSYHNGIVNMKQVSDAGCRYVGIRAGYGKNNIDQKYIKNAEACYNLGMLPLLYWFSYAYTEEMAAAEAEYAIQQAKKYWKKCLICFDFEYDSISYAKRKGVAVTKEMCTAFAIAFLRKIAAAGYVPVLYFNKDYRKNYFNIVKIKEAVPGLKLWYARYTSNISEGELVDVDIWQYTSSGKLPGVSGKVDMNNFYTEVTADIPVEKTEKAPTCNLYIKEFQQAANADGYRDADGKKLVEDGLDGPKTQYVRKKIALKAKKSGLIWKVGSSGYLVRWWQSRCNDILGHNQTEDGRFGKTSRAETIALQKKLNLAADGIAGYNSLSMVFYN